MDVLNLLESFGIPLTIALALGYSLSWLIKWLLISFNKTITTEFNELKDIVVKLIDANTLLRDKVRETRSDISTLIEFLKNGRSKKKDHH